MAVGFHLMMMMMMKFQKNAAGEEEKKQLGVRLVLNHISEIDHYILILQNH
jgi:hypothetical protein